MGDRRWKPRPCVIASQGGISGTGVSCDFDEANLDDRILSWVYQLGMRQATEVQLHLIRAVGSGADVVMEAPPGQGRTSGLCIGVVQRLVVDPSLRILIIVPTQEMGLRCRGILMPLASRLQDMNVTCYTVVKGNALRRDLHELRDRKPTIVVGQSNRLAALCNEDPACLDGFGIVVLVQAEHLLDERYEDLSSLMDHLRPPDAGRQTVVCSTRALPLLATQRHTERPIEIKVQRMRPTMEGVWALFLRVEVDADEQHRVDALMPLYQTLVIEQVVVFCKDPGAVERAQRVFAQEGFTTIVVFAHETEVQRAEALRTFRLSMFRVLITDIDVTEEPLGQTDQADMIVHMDMPSNADEFLHRSGREGPGPRKRLSASFASSVRDEKMLDTFQDDLDIEFVEVSDEMEEADQRPPQ